MNRPSQQEWSKRYWAFKKLSEKSYEQWLAEQKKENTND